MVKRITVKAMSISVPRVENFAPPLEIATLFVGGGLEVFWLGLLDVEEGFGVDPLVGPLVLPVGCDGCWGGKPSGKPGGAG